MPKLTRRAYLAQCAALDAKIAEVTAKIAAIDELWEAAPTPELSDRANSLYDARNDLQNDRRWLDREWDTRNWTGADWQSWELVCNNVD